MASAEGKEEAEMSGAASLLFLAEIIANGFTPNSPYATMAANGPAAPLPAGVNRYRLQSRPRRGDGETG
jgi:hypothetical protein